MAFDAKSSNMDKVLLINPSTNVFAFWDANVHHKDWLTYSSWTDGPVELFYNFSISYDLNQMVNFPTWIPDCDSYGPALWDLFLSSDTSICSTLAFLPYENSDHVVVSASIDFLSNTKGDSLLHHITYDYSHTYLDGRCDHLRDVPWRISLNWVLLLLLMILQVGSGWNWSIYHSW